MDSRSALAPNRSHFGKITTTSNEKHKPHKRMRAQTKCPDTKRKQLLAFKWLRSVAIESRQGCGSDRLLKLRIYLPQINSTFSAYKLRTLSTFCVDKIYVKKWGNKIERI